MSNSAFMETTQRQDFSAKINGLQKTWSLQNILFQRDKEPEEIQTVFQNWSPFRFQTYPQSFSPLSTLTNIPPCFLHFTATFSSILVLPKTASFKGPVWVAQSKEWIWMFVVLIGLPSATKVTRLHLDIKWYPSISFDGSLKIPVYSQKEEKWLEMQTSWTSSRSTAFRTRDSQKWTYCSYITP